MAPQARTCGDRGADEDGGVSKKRWDEEGKNLYR